jgi:allantoate deiminase
MALDVSARTVMERCDILSRYSEETERLTRRFATSPMRQVNEIVGEWMRAAGMATQVDQVGNIVGRYEAAAPGAKTLLLGSHLDTVRDAGKYDGILGVLIALACVERLAQRHERLPFALEVLGFADEEGVRYHTAYLGSRAMTGTLDQSALALLDDDGVALAEAIRQFSGDLDPQLLHTPRWQRDDLLGYCEVHIEQGPVLETLGIPVGVVTAISGQHRYTLKLDGTAGHAGTVPMGQRRDALCAAAQCILAVEEFAQATPGLVATVGKITAQPGASNVIPGRVTMSLDVRHPDDALRKQVCRALREQISSICAGRDIAFDWQSVQEHATIQCTERLQALFARAIEQVGVPVYYLPSGAGHDAVVMSELTDVAMLFVRCKGGISHHPDEAVAVEDVAVALDVLEKCISSMPS